MTTQEVCTASTVPGSSVLFGFPDPAIGGSIRNPKSALRNNSAQVLDFSHFLLISPLRSLDLETSFRFRPDFTPSWVVRNLRLHQLRQQYQRLLPPHVAGLRWNRCGDSLLRNIQLRSTKNFLHDHRRLHFPRKIRIVELVRIPNPLVRDQFEELAPKRMTLPRREIRKRHLVRPAHLRVHLVNLTAEPIWRKPLRHGIRINKRAINPLRLRPEHSMQFYSICCHNNSSSIFNTTTNDPTPLGHPPTVRFKTQKNKNVPPGAQRIHFQSRAGYLQSFHAEF